MKFEACRTRRVMWTVLIASAIAYQAPARLTAQEPTVLSELPDSVAERVVAFYNHQSTTRLMGEARITPGTELHGRVAVVGGPLILGGRIDGDVVVINGDLRLESTAELTGHATVVGGAASGPGLARLSSSVSSYRPPLRYRHDADALVYTPPRPQTGFAAGRDFGFARTDVLVAARSDYNRVEGLPIWVGPRLRLGNTNPTLLEALAIYRSSAGLRIDPDQIGYSIRAEQFLGGGRTARLGLRTYSEMAPVEQWGLSDRENSLATFVLHTDYRDAYEREGWAAYVRLERAGWPYDITVEYRDEIQRSVTPSSPWSLFDNQDVWRPEPIVAEGAIRSVLARVEYDTRNEEVEPSAGWHVVGGIEQGLGGRLEQPSAPFSDPDSSVFVGVGARERFTAAFFDVRRYARLTPEARIALRVLASGSVDGTPLPPQRQQTLGGEGSLPGFALFRFDCGARRRTISLRGEVFFPYYGCDRLALFQMEVQSTFPFARRFARSTIAGVDVGQTLRWVAFFDLGRAWSDDAGDVRLGGSSEFSADAGVGIRAGRIGAYWAVPLTRGGQRLNFFVRLGRRF